MDIYVYVYMYLYMVMYIYISIHTHARARAHTHTHTLSRSHAAWGLACLGEFARAGGDVHGPFALRQKSPITWRERECMRESMQDREHAGGGVGGGRIHL